MKTPLNAFIFVSLISITLCMGMNVHAYTVRGEVLSIKSGESVIGEITVTTTQAVNSAGTILDIANTAIIVSGKTIVSVNGSEVTANGRFIQDTATGEVTGEETIPNEFRQAVREDLYPIQ